MSLDLAVVQQRCRDRLEEMTAKFGPNHGEGWSLNDWIVAVTGELGEFANISKKVRRGDLTIEDALPDLRLEFADIMAYLMYVANKLDIDISEVFVEKWNIIGHRLLLEHNMNKFGDRIERFVP